MNNLKRVLSLGLTGAMLTGMMMVGASAATFTDADEITHTEAVNTMALLNVINGKEDGSFFDPAGTVSRAEMAKMITVALNGGKAPIIGTKVQPTYTDIKGNWAESYIEYCSNLGIISGRGDGTFDPNGTVTGSQAAKMMLVAMGYDVDVFGFTGMDWELNVNRNANDADLYDELEDIDPTEGLSRDSAAQLIYNGIQADTLEKEPSKVVSTGEITYNYNKTGSNILKDKFKVATNYGQLVKVDEDKLAIVHDASYASKCTGVATDVAFTKVADDYSDLLGQTVKVLYKGLDKVVGVAPLNCNKTYTTTFSAVEVDGSSKVKFGGTSYTVNSDTNTVSTIIDGAALVAKSNTYFAAPLSYNEVTFVDNDADGELEYAVVTTVTPAKVTYVSSTEIIAGGDTYKFSKNTIADDIAKGDYVTITKDLFNNNNVITKVAAVEGTVSGYKTDDTNEKYMVDGEWYIHAGKGKLDGAKAGDAVKFYAVNGVIYTGEKTEETTIGNLVMLVDYEASNLTNYAKILKADGTKATVKIDKFLEADGETAIAVPTRGNLFTYAETDDGYKFTAAKSIGTDYTWTDGDSNDVTTASSKIDKVGGNVIDDDAVVFVYNVDGTVYDAKVITGKQLKKLDAHASDEDKVDTTSFGYFTSEVGGLTRATYIGVAMTAATEKLPGVTNDGSLYGIITTNAYEDSADYITYDLWTGDENVTVREKDISAVGARTVGKVINYSSVTTENVIKDVQAVAMTAAAVKGMIGDQVSFDGTKMLDLTEKTVYLYIDSAKDGEDMGLTEGEVVRADKVEGVYVQNVLEYDDGADVKVLVVDVKNVLNAKYATKKAITLTPGTLTDATAVFTDINGNSLDGATDLKAGDIVTLTITASDATNVKVTYNNTKVTLVGDRYNSGTTITLTAGQTWVRSFVVNGTDNTSITVADV